MKKNYLKIIAIILLFPSVKVSAQNKSHYLTGFSTEIDPAPFLQQGYSVAVGYEFNHLRLSANLFSSNLPSFAVQKNWNAKIKMGSAFRVQYYFNKDCTGFYAGAQAGFLRMNYKKEGQVNYSEVTQFAITPTFGYRWFPFSKCGLYIMPAAGVGFTISTSGKVSSGAATYNQYKPSYIAALHIGYKF